MQLFILLIRENNYISYSNFSLLSADFKILSKMEFINIDVGII